MSKFFLLMTHSLLFLIFTLVAFLLQNYFKNQNILISELIIFFYIYLVSIYVILLQSKRKTPKLNSIKNLITRNAIIENNRFVDLMSVLSFGIEWSKLNSYKKLTIIIKIIILSFIFSLISAYIKTRYSLDSYLFFYVIFLILVFMSSILWIIVKKKP
jgi:hypothetical protein